MKKIVCLILALLCLLTGCRSAGPVSDDPAVQPSGSETTLPANTDSSETTEATQPARDSVTMGQTGKLRLTYTGNRSGVRYITDPSQLPDYPELAGYDAAYFQEHGLLLVTETVASSSVNVEIQSIVVENGIALVTLDHQIPSGQSTADMTTWLLWVEVDAGLDLSWSITNPAFPPEAQQGERY